MTPDCGCPACRASWDLSPTRGPSGSGREIGSDASEHRSTPAPSGLASFSFWPFDATQL